jgi:hypothetical protein
MLDLRAMVAVASLAMVAACATAPVRPGEAQAGAQTAFQTPGPGTVPVTFTRDAGYTGSGCSFEVLVEGAMVGRLWSRETITLHLPAGETIVGVRPAGSCALGQSARGLREMEVTLRPERPLFFRLGYDNQQQVSFSRTGLR